MQRMKPWDKDTGSNRFDRPSEIQTKTTPLARLGRVSDIAPLAVFLASDESAWITGEVIRASSGLVMAT